MTFDFSRPNETSYITSQSFPHILLSVWITRWDIYDVQMARESMRVSGHRWWRIKWLFWQVDRTHWF